MQSLSRELLDRSDLTVTLDERDDINPRIEFQARKDNDQELPASEASASGVAVGVAGNRDEHIGERCWSPRLCPMFT